MSLARAFTSRRGKADISPITPQRSVSARNTSGKPVQRSQISAPIQLLSTTNMLSFNAPDIPNSAASSVTSGDDSDLSRGAQNSPDTSVDGSPIESRPSSPEVSNYFQPGPLDSIVSLRRNGSDSSTDGPAIPKRAPSHTKASHRAMARKRAQARMSPPVTMPRAQESVLSVGSSHPFGKELQQVNEVAEQFGVREDLFEEEEQLKERGLLKFGAQDYILEIEGLFGGVFEDKFFLPMAWI